MCLWRKLYPILIIQWKNLLSEIDQNKKIKYLPYIDLSEMKSVLLSNIMDKMKKIHNRKGIPFIA